MNLVFSSRRIALVLILLVLCLILSNLATEFSKFFLGHDHLLGLVPLFYVGAEANIPTWFSSVMLLLSSILLAMIAFAKKCDRDRYLFHWIVLSLIFLCLSMDEVAQIHERLSLLSDYIVAPGTSSFFRHSWVISGAAFVIIFVLMYIRFLFNLPIRIRYLFLTAGTLLAGGAIGLEMIYGYWREAYGYGGIGLQMIVALEEFLEMLGAVIFIYALMSYMSSHVKEVHVTFIH
jgi:hypothetical protein